MLEASFELLVPLVMAAVIDKGIAQKDSPYIIRMCLVLIVLGIVGLICSLTAQYFRQKRRLGSEQDCGMRCLNIFNISVFRKWMKSAVLRL